MPTQLPVHNYTWHVRTRTLWTVMKVCLFFFFVFLSIIDDIIRTFNKFQTISSHPRQCSNNITLDHVHTIVRTLLLLLLFTPHDVSRALILLKSPVLPRARCRAIMYNGLNPFNWINNIIYARSVSQTRPN